jgi:hypothetical protein
MLFPTPKLLVLHAEQDSTIVFGAHGNPSSKTDAITKTGFPIRSARLIALSVPALHPFQKATKRSQRCTMVRFRIIGARSGG